MLPALEVSEAVKVLVVISLSQSPADKFQVYVGMDTTRSTGKSDKILAVSSPIVILAFFFVFPKPELRSWNMLILSFPLFCLSRM